MRRSKQRLGDKPLLAADNSQLAAVEVRLVPIKEREHHTKRRTPLDGIHLRVGRSHVLSQRQHVARERSRPIITVRWREGMHVAREIVERVNVAGHDLHLTRDYADNSVGLSSVLTAKAATVQ